MTENEAWALYKKRRKKRMDEKEGRWVTTENNHKVHIGGDGEPDMGNPRVLEKMVGKVAEKKPEKYKSFAKDINSLDKKGIVVRAKKDPEFKELIDAITLYTQGAYGMQKHRCEDMVKSGVSDKDDLTVAELAKSIDDDGFVKQLWNGQKLFESQSSVNGGIASMIGAINNSKEDSPELYRLADDRGWGSITHEKLYLPPKVGDKIKMDAPTSFTKDKEVLKEVAKAKYGDRIYYTLEPGARSLDIERISRFKQKESLTCGEFEVTDVRTDVHKLIPKSKVDGDKRNRERFKGRPTAVDENGEEWYGPLKVYITIRQVGKTEFGKRVDSTVGYIDTRNHFDDEWKTIKGTHVLIDDYGRISKGPAALKLLDKWKKKKEGKKATYELSDECKPTSMDYDLSPEDDFQAFVKKNYDKAMDIYGEKGMGGVEEEYYKLRLAQCTKDFHLISDKEMNKAIKDNIDEARAEAWLVGYDHEVKPKLVYDMTKNPEVHNAMLNKMYKDYVVYTKYAEKKTPLPFEEFLVTPVKMYRGGSGKGYKTAAPFSSYSFDRKIAEGFKSDPTGHGKASDPGNIYEAMIRPIDTFGGMGSLGEMEVFVPGFIAPNGRYDSDTDEESGGGHGNTKLPFGLCQREGIEIQPGWTPQDAWKALEGKGYSVSEAYKELKKTGKVSKNGSLSKTAGLKRRVKEAFEDPDRTSSSVRNAVKKTLDDMEIGDYVKDQYGFTYKKFGEDDFRDAYTDGTFSDKKNPAEYIAQGYSVNDDEIEFLDGKEYEEQVRRAKEERVTKAKESAAGKTFELSSDSKPEHSDYEYEPFCSGQEWARNNMDKLKPIYKERGRQATEDERYKYLMEKNSEGLYEMNLQDIRETLYENPPEPLSSDRVSGWLRGWYVEANGGYKPKLAEYGLCTPETRNASLNLAYYMYKNEHSRDGEEVPPFEEWLVTPMKVWRGHSKEQHKSDDDWNLWDSYSFRKSLAEKFAEDYQGEVSEIEIRPIDTFGSIGSYMDGENEILIPRWKVPYRNYGKREDSKSAIDKQVGKCYNKTNTNFDADEETNDGGNNRGSGGHGNTRIPYGLCQREGITIQPGWTPSDAWKALEGKGYSAGAVYKELKKTGKVGGKSGSSEKPKKPKTSISINSFPEAMTKKGYMENTLVAVSYINSHCDDGVVTDFFNIGKNVDVPPNFHCRRSSSGEGCALEIWTKRYTGEITKSQLIIPNFSAYDNEEEKAAAVRSFAHEWTHYLDHAVNDWGKQNFSEEHEGLKKAVGSFSVDKMSDEAKNLFKEYDQKYGEETAKFLKATVSARKEYPTKKFGPDKSKWPKYIDEDGYVDYTKAVAMGQYFDAEEYGKGLQKYKKDLVHATSKKTRALMDGLICLQGLYDSLSCGELYSKDVVKYGHEKKYFRDDPGARYSEALADYVALKATSPKYAEVFSRNFPEIAKALDQTMEDMVKKAGSKA